MRGLALMVALAACPPRPNPPVRAAPDMAPSIPVCVPARNVTPANVCTGLYTADGLACVNCPGAAGCIDDIDSVYCITGGCLSDGRCAPH
jgi:hypothetical protein